MQKNVIVAIMAIAASHTRMLAKPRSAKRPAVSQIWKPPMPPMSRAATFLISFESAISSLLQNYAMVYI